MNKLNEKWKTYPLNNNYLVSDKGHVRHVKKEKSLIGIEDKNGYLTVKIYKTGRYKTMKIHRLVAITFLDRINGREEVNHIDGDKKNNRLENIEWSNRRLNMKHAVNNGLVSRGENNPNAKLSGEEVAYIRKTYASGGITQVELAGEFNINNSQISRIINNKIYKECTK